MVLGGSSSGGRLGTATLDLRANAGPLDRGLERSEKNVRRSTGRMGKAVKVVGFAFAGAGVAAAGIGVAALKLAADFDKAFSEVRTLLPNVSDEAFGALQKDLRDFSNETGTVTTEAIPALYQAISAGVPRENVMDFLRVANKAAVGGVTDLETAVDAITSSVNSYGPEVLSATEASDLMFTAVRLGKTTFNELGAALFNVVPTAASFGVGLDQVAAALAVTTAQGVPTKIATTQLRQAFVEAGKESTKLAKTIKERTGKSFSQLIKEGKPVHRIFQDLREDMPEDDFRNLFSSVEAANAALLITGDAAERVDDALAEMSTSAGATDKAFETVADTATFKMQKSMNLMRNVLLEIGVALLPALVEVLDKAVLPALTAFAGWMSDHSDEMAAGVIAVVDAAVELGSATKTAVNDAIAAYTRFITWGENNVDRAKTFWQDTTTEALALKTAVNTDVLTAYGSVLTWGTDNKAKLEQLWADTTTEALALKTAVNTDVLTAYGELVTWGTDNKAKLEQLWADTTTEALALKTAVNTDVLTAYGNVLTWGTDNKAKLEQLWADTTTEALALKTAVNTDVLTAYGNVLTWGTDNKAKLKSLWSGVSISARVLKADVSGATGSVLAAYKSVLTWGTDNKAKLKSLWSGVSISARVLKADVSGATGSVLAAYKSVLTWGTDNKADLKSMWSGVSLPPMPDMPFADEPMEPVSIDTGQAIDDINDGLAEFEKKLQGINDDWLTMAALVVTVGGLLLGGPFGWIGAGIGATRLLKNFLPDIRTWLAENNAAIAKELDPLLWGLEESLAAAWGEGLPEVPPEVLQKAPEDRNWLFQWWIDHDDEFYGAADAIAKGIRNVTEALKNAKLDWTNFWPLNLMETAAKATLEAIWAIAWLIDRSDELFQETPPQHQIELDVRRGLTGADLPYTGLGPIAPPGFLEAMPDDSALGSLATALGSIGGGRTMVFNVENLYGVDDLEDFVQEANLAALRRGQENVLD